MRRINAQGQVAREAGMGGGSVFIVCVNPWCCNTTVSSLRVCWPASDYRPEFGSRFEVLRAHEYPSNSHLCYSLCIRKRGKRWHEALLYNRACAPLATSVPRMQRRHHERRGDSDSAVRLHPSPQRVCISISTHPNHRIYRDQALQLEVQAVATTALPERPQLPSTLLPSTPLPPAPSAASVVAPGYVEASMAHCPQWLVDHIGQTVSTHACSPSVTRLRSPVHRF